MPDMPDELDVPDEPNEKYAMNVGVQRKSGDFSTLQTTSNDFKRLQPASTGSRYTGEYLDIRSPINWQGNCFVFTVVRSHGKT
jgi:hypothetical protein